MRSLRFHKLKLFASVGIIFWWVASSVSQELTPAKGRWLQSESAAVRLGVWDKDGIFGNYDAVFFVVGPDQMQYKATKQARGDWAYVYFPTDFRTNPSNGEYSWRCLVKGKTVVQGRFEYKDHTRTVMIFR